MVGVGGYASGPAMLAGGIMNVPLVAFEPNYIPGFANRMLGPLVQAAVVQFEATCRYFRDCHVTGVPVRSEFFRVPPRPANARPTLLVFGGSQGAHAINVAVLGALEKLSALLPDICIIHQTGEKDYVDAQAAYLKTHDHGRGFALHRRYAGRFRARRPAGVPLGRQHGGGSHRCRTSGDLHSAAHRG